MNQKLLIVDDDVDIQNFLKLKLEKDGFEVSCASDPIAAFKQIQTSKPDLMILDVMMPEMTGYEFLKFVKENAKQFSSIPVIAISARESVSDCFNSWDIYKFVKKPLDYPSFLKTVNAALGFKESDGSSQLKAAVETKEEVIPERKEQQLENKKRALVISTDYGFIEKLGDVLKENHFEYQMKDGGKETLSFIESWKPDILLGHYSDTTMDIDFQGILSRVKEKGLISDDKMAIVCPPATSIDARKEFKNVAVLPYQQVKDLSPHVKELA